MVPGASPRGIALRFASRPGRRGPAVVACPAVTISLRLIVNSFRPFGSRDMRELEQLDKAWQQPFDGIEVLPACFEPKARSEPFWLARGRYLVPRERLSAPAFQTRTGMTSVRCFITEAPYDPDLGLIT
jgi:hypothetical protein